MYSFSNTFAGINRALDCEATKAQSGGGSVAFRIAAGRPGGATVKKYLTISLMFRQMELFTYKAVTCWVFYNAVTRLR